MHTPLSEVTKGFKLLYMTAPARPLVKNKAGEGESCAFINFAGPRVLEALFLSIIELCAQT